MGAVYFIMEKLKRPIANKTGFRHFALILAALIFSLFARITTDGVNDAITRKDVWAIVLNFAPTALFMISMIMFLLALMKAIARGKQE